MCGFSLLKAGGDLSRNRALKVTGGVEGRSLDLSTASNLFHVIG